MGLPIFDDSLELSIGFDIFPLGNALNGSLIGKSEIGIGNALVVDDAIALFSDRDSFNLSVDLASKRRRR